MITPKFFKRKKPEANYPPGFTQNSYSKTGRKIGNSQIFRFSVNPLSQYFKWIKDILGGLMAIFSKSGLRTIKNNLMRLISFTLLLSLYLFNTQVMKRIFTSRFSPRFLTEKLQPAFAHFYLRSISLLDRQTGSISRIDLIELSLRNMQVKRTRTVVTVGGMAIGIAAIVFLVSVGYGLQQLVISRVARLDEMKQADVYPQAGSQIKINDKTLSDFKGITNVIMALPLIAVVGRVNYQNSVSDMAVYGVTADYLKESAIKPVEGKIFDSNEIAMEVPHTVGEVAGVATTAEEQLSSVIATGEQIGNVSFTISPGVWIRVREGPNTTSKVIGYTKGSEGIQNGNEVWGGVYTDQASGKAGKDKNDKWLGKWINAPVLLWKQQSCEKNKGDCEDGKYVVLRDKDGAQVQKSGFFAEVNIALSGQIASKETQVLGVSTNSNHVASSSGSLSLVDIASESATVANTTIKNVSLPDSSIKQAVVNRAMLKILGINESQAVGKTFDASFVVVGDLLTDNKEQVESNPASYTIVGVIPDDKTPLFYVPFTDIRSLGIVNYSQVKVVTQDQNSLNKVRKLIEAEGYVTRSVVDTVSQIDSLFATVRIVLALLGTVALVVAALGMFNTLTVSLLERTREVGLMKAMGMKSSEVKELFLTESMIMGLFGGLFGTLFGFLAGKLLGLILSVFAIIKGVGFIDVSYLPLPFLLLVIGLSLVVGIMTGFYPARRATKISALNALRYE